MANLNVFAVILSYTWFMKVNDLVRRWTQHFTKISLEKSKIEQICIWNPTTGRIYYVNSYRVSVFVAESQTFSLRNVA